MYEVSLWISEEKSNFLRFFIDSSDLNNALMTEVELTDLLLQRAVPVVESYLKDLSTQVAAVSNQLQSMSSLVQNFQCLPADIFR